MALPQPLTPGLIDQIADRFRVLSEPMRIQILDQLRGGERPVSELVAGTGTTQQNVSKHLAILHREGVVGRRKDGNRVLYRITDESVLALCEHVCGTDARHAAEAKRAPAP